MINYQSVLIIYNPNALKGKVEDIMPQIKQRLSLRYSLVDAVSSPNEESAEEIAFRVANKYDIVVACGGDGTVHRVVNGVMKSNANCLVGVLPFGTTNDIARTLNVPLDFNKSIDCLLRLNYVDYDIMFDGNDYIVYSLATGYLTQSIYETSIRAKKHFGRLAYFFSALKAMFKYKPIPMTITHDGVREHCKVCYFMLLEGKYAGGFKLRDCQRLDDDNVKMVMIKKGKSIGCYFTFLRLFLHGIKSIKNNKNVVICEAKDIEIENHSNSAFTLDGERIKFLKKRVEVKKGLKLIKE